MTKRTRTILFFSFVFLFIATIPVLTVYTQGYRLDWENRQLVKTGGMDFGVRPLGVRVFVDGEFQKETNFLFRDIIIRNILPREYDIRIEREGYSPWHKSVVVQESIVTKFVDARLFPANPTRTDIGEGIVQVIPAPDGRTALVRVEAEKSLEQIRMLSFSGERLETPVLTLRANERVQNAGWNAESTVAWFVTTLGQDAALYTVSVQEPGNPVAWNTLTNTYRRGTLQTALILPTPSATSIFVAPYDTRNKLYSIDSLIIGQKEPISVAEEVRTASSVDSSLVYLDQENILFERDMPSGELSVLATTLLDTEITQPVRLIVEDNVRAVALLAGSDAYLWQRGYEFSLVSNKATGALFSPDATKLAFWNEEGLSVFWMETLFGPPARTRGEIEFILSQKGIDGVTWLETLGAHIVATTDQDIFITELDGRGGRNTVSYTIENASSFFSPILQRVYALTETGRITTFSVE